MNRYPIYLRKAIVVSSSKKIELRRKQRYCSLLKRFRDEGTTCIYSIKLRITRLPRCCTIAAQIDLNFQLPLASSWVSASAYNAAAGHRAGRRSSRRSSRTSSYADFNPTPTASASGRSGANGASPRITILLHCRRCRGSASTGSPSGASPAASSAASRPPPSSSHGVHLPLR